MGCVKSEKTVLQCHPAFNGSMLIELTGGDGESHF